MYAETGLLSNHLHENLNLVKTPEPLNSLGKSLCMITQAADNFPSTIAKAGETGRAFIAYPVPVLQMCAVHGKTIAENVDAQISEAVRDPTCWAQET